MVPRDMNILAVGAHPDDVEWGCYGLLARLRPHNTIRALVLTMGERCGPNRADETRAAFATLNIPVSVLEYPDGDLVATPKSIADVGVLADAANVVLTPTRWDNHQDHRAAEQITISACRRRPVTLVGYHSISSTPDFPTNMILDVSAVIEEKIRALACHRSQAAKAYMDREFIRRWHHEKAATAVGMDAVELFHIYCAFVLPQPQGALSAP